MPPSNNSDSCDTCDSCDSWFQLWRRVSAGTVLIVYVLGYNQTGKKWSLWPTFDREKCRRKCKMILNQNIKKIFDSFKNMKWLISLLIITINLARNIWNKLQSYFFQLFWIIIVFTMCQKMSGNVESVNNSVPIFRSNWNLKHAFIA